MKKILSMIVFFALMVWTWNVIHSSQAIGFETHTAIQEKMAEMIKQTLLAKKPNSDQLEFTRMWTENLEANKVRVVFSYKFHDKNEAQEQTLQTIEGEAMLLRQSSENPAIDSWKLLSVKTTADSVIYQEGSVVTPDESK